MCVCDACVGARGRRCASACRTSPSRRGSTCSSNGTSSQSRCALIPASRWRATLARGHARGAQADRPPEPGPDPIPHPDPPQDLTTDFGDGIKLIKLVENISEETLGKYHKNPTSRIQKIENINLPIKYINSFVASIGIKNTYSAENIIDQDKQFILGMVWTLTPTPPLSLTLTSTFYPRQLLPRLTPTLPLPLTPTLTRCGRSSCASRSTSARRAT